MTLPERADVVIVGAGPAGATAAATLALAGRDVLLLEKDQFPRDKLCGEFLSGEAERWLDATGALEPLRKLAPPHIHDASFVVPSGGRARIALPAPGIGISRRRLDHTLFDAAVAAGANGVTKAEVVRIDDRDVEVRRGDETSTVRADVIVAAHGRRARLDKQLGRQFIERRHPYVGLKRHHEDLGTGLEGQIELFVFDGGYCGMSHVEGGTMNVCMLVEERFVRALGGAEWGLVTTEIARRHAAFGARLETLAPKDEPVAVAQIPFEDKERHHGSTLFAGDAAAMIAPLTGDGQAMAIESGAMLAELVLANPPDRLPEVWDRTWRKRFAPRLTLARNLQRALLSPRTARALVGTVGRFPSVGRALARMTRSG